MTAWRTWSTRWVVRGQRCAKPSRRIGSALGACVSFADQRGRADTTSISVYHERADGTDGLLQFGKSKDHRPALRQYMQALGTLDPAGIPLVSETLDGNAGDPLMYLPVWRRLVKVIGHTDWLFVGDSKLHSAQNIAEIHRAKDWLLTPLQMNGHMPEHFAEWLRQQPKHLQTLTFSDANGSQRRVGHGYEVAHTLTWNDPQNGETVTVPLGVFMVQRDSFKEKQIHDLHRRLECAEAAVQALNGQRGDTPTEREALQAQAQTRLTEHQVAEYMSVQVQWREQHIEKFVGPGRPGPQRRKQTRTYQVAQVSIRRKPAVIQAYEDAAGRRAYATNAPKTRLTVQQAVEASQASRVRLTLL